MFDGLVIPVLSEDIPQKQLESVSQKHVRIRCRRRATGISTTGIHFRTNPSFLSLPLDRHGNPPWQQNLRSCQQRHCTSSRGGRRRNSLISFRRKDDQLHCSVAVPFSSLTRQKRRDRYLHFSNLWRLSAGSEDTRFGCLRLMGFVSGSGIGRLAHRRALTRDTHCCGPALSLPWIGTDAWTSTGWRILCASSSPRTIMTVRLGTWSKANVVDKTMLCSRTLCRWEWHFLSSNIRHDPICNEFWETPSKLSPGGKTFCIPTCRRSRLKLIASRGLKRARLETAGSKGKGKPRLEAVRMLKGSLLFLHRGPLDPDPDCIVRET